MKLRDKIWLRLTFITTLFVSLLITGIYVSLTVIRTRQFQDYLLQKAKFASIYLQKDTSKIQLEKATAFSTKLTNENILAYDTNDKLIFKNTSSSLIVNYSLLSQIKKKTVTSFSTYESEAVGYHYKGPVQTITVIVAGNDIYGSELLNKLRDLLIILFLLTIPIIVWMGKVYADKYVNPIKSLKKSIQNIDKERYGENNFEGDFKDDLSEITASINQMTGKLKLASQIQKQFISNASHELRTPLTIISGQMEVLLMNDRTPEEYRIAIDNNLHDIQELINIYNQLLILAHASSDFSEIFKTQLRIDEIIWCAREELQKIYPHYKISVEFSENIREDGQFLILGNELLLLSALTNLMENGCKFSDNKAVAVFIENEPQNLLLKFKDKGKGIDKEELLFIFEPFYKGNNKASRGKGIGLSIARKVIELHKGTITVKSDVQQGTEIIVSLPLAFPLTVDL